MQWSQEESQASEHEGFINERKGGCSKISENVRKKCGLIWDGKEEIKKEAMEETNGKTLKYAQADGMDAWNTGNVLVEGGNLDALKLLRRSYCGKIGLIYIEPPFNVGIDLIYSAGFVVSRGFEGDSEASRLEKNETDHKSLRCGIHEDWLGMMYPRLTLAKDMLAENGVIFISIDDNEQANLKIICDEIFGSCNFLAQIVWEKPFSPVDSNKLFSICHEYIICYARNKDAVKCNGLSGNVESGIQYAGPGVSHRKMGKRAAPSTLWRCQETGHYRGVAKELDGLSGSGPYFRHLKPVELIKRCIQLFSADDSLVLDFLCASAATAHAVMELNAQSNGNRKYILVQTLEKNDQDGAAYGGGDGDACGIIKKRLLLAGGKVRLEHPKARVDTGFRVFCVEDADVDWDMDAGRLELMGADLNGCMHVQDDAGIVYELVFTKYGAPLSKILERLTDIGNRTYIYAKRYFVCLETEVTERLINKLADLDMRMEKYIFRDSAFRDDELKEWAFGKLGYHSAKGIGTGRNEHTVEFI